MHIQKNKTLIQITSEEFFSLLSKEIRYESEFDFFSHTDEAIYWQDTSDNTEGDSASAIVIVMDNIKDPTYLELDEMVNYLVAVGKIPKGFLIIEYSESFNY